MQVFQPSNQPNDFRVSCESHRNVEKKVQKGIVGKENPDKMVDFPTGRNDYTDKP